MITAKQIAEIVTKLKFNPKTAGALKIIADVGSPEYYRNQAVVLIRTMTPANAMNNTILACQMLILGLLYELHIERAKAKTAPVFELRKSKDIADRKYKTIEEFNEATAEWEAKYADIRAGNLLIEEEALRLAGPKPQFNDKHGA